MKNRKYILFILAFILIITIPKSKILKNIQNDIIYMKENETIPFEKNRNTTYTISNSGIVSINENKIIALKEGHTVITLETNTNKSLIDVYVVSLDNIMPRYDLYVGETLTLYLSTLSHNEFIWEVNDKEIIEIINNTIIARNSGTATVTLTLKENPNISKSIKINVISNLANKLIDNALNEEGYHEGENNYTKYGKWYGLPNSEWCAMFVSWVANKSNIPTNVIPKFASVREGKKFFENQGRYFDKKNYIPQKGDIIFFLNGISHTGIVTKVENGKVYTIEGNSSNKVAQRSYSLNDTLITGYGNPSY